MSSLGYSDFASGGGGGGGDATKRGASSSDDGYIATKRKNKTIKSFDSALNTGSSESRADANQAPLNPKLERLKQSIAKIHTASSDDDDDADANETRRTNMLPSYPGQGMGQSQGQKTSPPIADAGSGVTDSATTYAMSPPTTSDGYTQQPMFSLSQQSASRTSNATNGNGGGVEQFAMKMPSTYAAQYYKQYVPYNRMSNELSSAGANSDELIEKLNHIVHLLEEQHNERTDHVAEELVLYCFLGVFIIFIVDSFARAGKYTR
jgi:hypothetical protein